MGQLTAAAPGSMPIDTGSRASIATAAWSGLAIVAASFVAGLAAWQFAGTAGRDFAILTATLAATGWGGLFAGAAAMRWSRSLGFGARMLLFMGLGLTLLLANVAIAAVLMFISTHDLRLLLVLSGYAIAATAVPALLMGRSLGRRLERLEHAAARIAAGDLETRVVVEGSDDIARLSTAFNTMAAGLEDAHERREALERSRRDLFAAISHDLRTPLSSIRVMVEALSDGVVTDPETTARYLTTMSADVDRLSALIDDLFELARIDSGALQLRLERLTIGELLATAVDAIRPTADRARVAVRCEALQSATIEADPQRLTRVLANLLQNAVRHTPEDGSVVVSAGLNGPEVVVAVRDTGEGIPAADVPHVFERFYRGEKSRSRATGGSGLGLSISKGIVEAHGGRMWVDATGSGGTTVKFTVPQAR